MPANNVTATANYDFIDYTVSITGGTADKTTAHYGETVTITANAPETGKQFTGWTLTGVTVGDKTKAEITFEMPANNVTVTAEFEDIDYRVTVEGGTADKTTAHYGDSVTITADEPEKGKEFDKWTVTGLDTAGLDLTKPELTFTMPAYGHDCRKSSWRSCICQVDGYGDRHRRFGSHKERTFFYHACKKCYRKSNLQ